MNPTMKRIQEAAVNLPIIIGFLDFPINESEVKEFVKCLGNYERCFPDLKEIERNLRKGNIIIKQGLRLKVI